MTEPRDLNDANDLSHPADPADPGPNDRQVEQAIRWRLILGGHADDLAFDAGAAAATGLTDHLTEARALDTPLAYIYDREHAQRTHRQSGPGGGTGLTVPMWLTHVRALFPREAIQIMERDALTRYGLHELVTDAQVLRDAEPSEDLLRAILQFKHLMKPDVLEAARALVTEIVNRLAARLETDTRPALHGPISPRHRSPVRTFKNADWLRTIRRNLKNYDHDRQRIIADRIDFKHRQRRRSPWHITIAVDQSGSMTDSLIHAAVMAAIFARLPAIDVTLVLWDHRLVDMSQHATDPIEVLMSCQLGGGTRMLPAMQYCADRITDPQRTVFVLISDWYIWGERTECLTLARTLREAGVQGIGLSALDAHCRPVYDEQFARDLAATGWFVAAMTPKLLAEHVGRIIA